MRRRRNRLPVALPGIALAILVAGFAVKGYVDSEAPPPAAPAEEPVAAAAGPNGEAFDRYFESGVTLLEQGRPAEAARHFEAARALRPHVPELHVNLGYAYLDLGRSAEAQDAFETALALRPEQVNAFYGLAESLDRLGDRQGALGAMRTYVHLTPEDDPFRRRALSALWEWGTAEAGAPSNADVPEAGSIGAGASGRRP